MLNSRAEALQQWLSTEFSGQAIVLSPLSGDAGFRNYFRFSVQGNPYIAVDAPPQSSNNLGFVAIAQALLQQGIEVPKVISHDLEQGFLSISDFGEQLFADVISEKNMIKHYQQAIDLLPVIAGTKLNSSYSLPIYDKAFIELELSIFSEWLLATHLQINLSAQQQTQLEQCFNYLVDSALAQPQVFMHRDYHSRNIMCLAELSLKPQPEQSSSSTLGIIDFQDAVLGPITYDVVSLLRDCYVRWPDEQVEQLFDYFCQLITQELNLDEIPKAQWRRWFDLMGLQRHIKASGIFARLYHRDNKSGYLADIPLTLSYIIDISSQYPELAFLHQLVGEQVLPALLTMNKDEA